MVQNHRQQYCYDRIIQQYSYKSYYYRDKGVAHGMIHSGIPTPEKQETPIITLEEDSYSRKETNRFIFNLLKERNQCDEKLSSFPDLQSKGKASSPSPIGVESSQIST